jgi:hypothetical protein
MEDLPDEWMTGERGKCGEDRQSKRLLLALMIEAVRISETSIICKRCMPEDSCLYSRRSENLKSHTLM